MSDANSSINFKNWGPTKTIHFAMFCDEMARRVEEEDDSNGIEHQRVAAAARVLEARAKEAIIRDRMVINLGSFTDAVPLFESEDEFNCFLGAIRDRFEVKWREERRRIC